MVSRHATPPANSILHRDFNGRPIRVLMLQDEFEYRGYQFMSHTVLANRICGHFERLVKAFTPLPKPILGKTPELA